MNTTDNTPESGSEDDASSHDQRTAPPPDPFRLSRAKAHRTTTDSELPRVEMRVRDLTPAGVSDRQEAVYEQLLRLQEDGHVADVSLEVWGRQVRTEADTDPATDDAGTHAARSTYEEFEAWADRNGHDLEPAFSTHTLGSLVTDEQKEVIRFPVLCLAVYGADDLLAVVPCSTGDDVRTVDDCLTALQSGKWIPTAVEVGE